MAAIVVTCECGFVVRGDNSTADLFLRAGLDGGVPFLDGAEGADHLPHLGRAGLDCDAARHLAPQRRPGDACDHDRYACQCAHSDGPFPFPCG